jgi:hypothetical protein
VGEEGEFIANETRPYTGDEKAASGHSEEFQKEVWNGRFTLSREKGRRRVIWGRSHNQLVTYPDNRQHLAIVGG